MQLFQYRIDSHEKWDIMDNHGDSDEVLMTHIQKKRFLTRRAKSARHHNREYARMRIYMVSKLYLSWKLIIREKRRGELIPLFQIALEDKSKMCLIGLKKK